MSSLTVLGSSGAYPQPHNPCSGYLLEHDGFTVAIDLGYGTVGRLLEYLPDGAVDAVVITHEHADHCTDLHALMRVRLYGHPEGARIPLFCTEGVVKRVNGLDTGEGLSQAFDIHPWPETVRIGPFELTPFELPHHVPNFGVRLSAPGLTLAYTGDTGPSPALAELGRDADVFVVNAMDQGPPPGPSGNLLLTATDAGRAAHDAGARRLVLTHLWPGADPAVSITEARAGFAGVITAPVAGDVIALGPA
ncbi:MBL fold metallo-hydrolase [Phytomonospora sp. NPDC050363]|uniref:MBL fold metallo-hydrolase n=1 Tax=Phytomonospora sp. NPDC050363 TaxID=3155642 RepID=UPI0033D4BD32